MRLTRIAITAAALVAALAATSVTAAAPAQTADRTKNIVATAVAAGEFETLTSLLKQAGLARTLRREGPFTVFAPTDAAFAAVPKATLDALAQDREQLRRVLLYHVLDGRFNANRLANRTHVTTLAGPSLRVRSIGDELRVGGADVTAANVRASNGIIHVIDEVLIPR